MLSFNGEGFTMLRFLIYGIFIYLFGKLFKAIITPVSPNIQVKGQSKNRALDLSKEDVEDADYKDIPD